MPRHNSRHEARTRALLSRGTLLYPTPWKAVARGQSYLAYNTIVLGSSLENWEWTEVEVSTVLMGTSRL